MTIGWRAALECSIVLACVGCKDPPAVAVDAQTTVDSSIAPVARVAPSSTVQIDASGIAPLTVPCRLIVVTGDARTRADAGLHGLEAAPLDFVTLGASSSMTAKDGTTGREVTLKGPGSVRVCVGGREEEWLETGELASVPGAGESPGAEVWVITLHGVVRYSGGHTRVTASRTSTFVHSQLGAAVYPLPAATTKSEAGAPSIDSEGWIRLAPDANLELTGALDVRALLAACSKQAAITRDLAAAMMKGDAGPLGDAASRHVVERQRSRALCGMASLAAATARPFSQTDADQAASSDELWRQVPTR